MSRIELAVYALSPSYSSSRTYALVLAEKEGLRKLLVIIGEMEAQIIALELENVVPPRPLTHDLIKSITDNYDIRPTEIYIDSFFEGIFSSKISFTNKDGDNRIVDSRTSDAIILALKYKIPIYTSEEIMDSVGIIFTEAGVPEEGQESESPEKKEQPINTFSKEKLEQMLKEAEDAEEYERASMIMKEIEKKNKKS